MPDYTTQVSPNKVIQAVNRGFKRLENFRNARLMFLKAYVGQYYDRTSGTIGTEALNMIFNAIRVMVPNIVMTFPKHSLVTPYLAHKQYAEWLGLALTNHNKSIDIAGSYRRAIVDAVFTLGIMKTGLAGTDSVYTFDDGARIDPGSIFSDVISFDNFVADPNSKEHLFRDAAFLGDRMCVSRRKLLESGLYKNDLVERLPKIGDEDRRAFELSQRAIADDDEYLEEEVEIVELWVPSANAIVTVPGSDSVTMDDYLRVDDYYGVKEGPYTLLGLSPPVPDNPIPVPQVGVWHDLHILANNMAKKIVDQADRQKDVMAYRRGSADDAEELKNAADGESVAVDDPDAVNVLKFGGQDTKNEVHLAALQGWFNMMAGNPAQLGGQGIDPNGAGATGATILQQNASVGLEDMKDAVYKFSAEEGRRRAWYMHTDPLMQIPITHRQMTPAQMAVDPATGMPSMQPAGMQEVQVILTPEARRGEFLDFTFEVQPESMGRRDSKTQFTQAMEFCTKMMPAVFTAAQAGMQMGIAFSPKMMLVRMAKLADMPWFEEVFFDPEFQMQMAMVMAAGPQMAASKGQLAGGGAPAQPSLMNQILQNGQPASLPGPIASPDSQFRSDVQQGAVPAQRELKGGF